MRVPARKTIVTADKDLVVQITDDGSRTLVRTDGDYGYHSASGALSETRHVYLRNSGVGKRLVGGTATSVLEIGLGTGMGLLLTLDAAISAGTPLTYTAFEIQWPSVDVLRQLDPQSWLQDPDLADRFLQWRESVGTVSAGSYLWQVDETRQVTVRVEDLRHADHIVAAPVDAIYFDPFAPSVNPELWRADVLTRMHAALRVGGKIATYCVSRSVRDVFTSVGFRVRCVPGPEAGKREVLIATRESIP